MQGATGRLRRAVFPLALGVLTACAACAGSTARKGPPASIAAEPPPLGSGITFEEITKRAGLTFRFETDLRRGRNLATMGGGVPMGDYDGDGRLDLFFTGSAGNGKKPEAGPCGVLYRNRGDGTFEDTTARAKIRSCGWAMGAHWVDVDSDGRLDLIVTGVGKTQLFSNQGDGTFRELSEARGLIAKRYAVGLAAGDVNGDGRADLYIANYLETSYEDEQKFSTLQVRMPEDYAGQEGALYLQRADGTFTESTAASHARNEKGKGLGALFFDYDGDGKADLYIANDRVSNVLYRGHGDGTFDDVTAETGAGARDQKIARAGMGIAVGDVDGDGRPDLAVTNFAGEPTTLYHNVEGALFEDITESSGMGPASWPYVQWGVELVDFDDDGAVDLVASSGHLVPRLLSTLGSFFRKEGLGVYGQGDRSYHQPLVLWRNDGTGRFAAVTETSGDLARLRISGRGLSAGDVDGDGRLDLALTAVSGGIHLLRNSTRVANHAVEILPVAGADRRTVLGTKVIVTSGARRQVQEFVLRPSYASGSWVPLHFGLGAASSVDRIEIIPPGETSPRHTLAGIAADRLYRLDVKEGSLKEVRRFSR
ncbi:MAG: CRTAC1 family protein [Thermoanaerobaculia bacterium]